MSRHAQLLADYQYLRSLGPGVPYDAGEYYDKFADDMLERPTKAEACIHLSNLIELFYERGGPQGESFREDDKAQEIFIRRGLMEGDSHE